MSTNTTPSAGAVRAAERIEQAFANGFPRCNQSNIAEIIDRETGAGRLAEALEMVLSSAMPHPVSHPSMSKAWDNARAAIAAWKEGRS